MTEATFEHIREALIVDRHLSVNIVLQTLLHDCKLINHRLLLHSNVIELLRILQVSLLNLARFCLNCLNIIETTHEPSFILLQIGHRSAELTLIPLKLINPSTSHLLKRLLLEVFDPLLV